MFHVKALVRERTNLAALFRHLQLSMLPRLRLHCVYGARPHHARLSSCHRSPSDLAPSSCSMYIVPLRGSANCPSNQSLSAAFRSLNLCLSLLLCNPSQDGNEKCLTTRDRCDKCTDHRKKSPRSKVQELIADWPWNMQAQSS
jgi:hypothetical protein